jgi:hypothetical protein
MRRVAYVLAVFGILCVAASQAQAHNPYYHNGYHHAYYGPAFIGPRVVVVSRVAVPTAICPQPLFYRPVYSYPYCPSYAPAPGAGFYYRSRGVSLGIGW